VVPTYCIWAGVTGAVVTEIVTRRRNRQEKPREHVQFVSSEEPWRLCVPHGQVALAPPAQYALEGHE
jgi:hypothetical protein